MLLCSSKVWRTSFWVAFPPRLLAKSPRNPWNDWMTYGRKCWSSQSEWQKMAMSHHHEWYVTAFLFFSSLKTGRLTFALRPLPAYTDLLLSSEALINVAYWELHLLLLPNPSLPNVGEPHKGSLGTLGNLYYLCLLLFLPPCWGCTLCHSHPHSSPSLHPSSTSEAASMPCIHSSTP